MCGICADICVYGWNSEDNFVDGLTLFSTFAMDPSYLSVGVRLASSGGNHLYLSHFSSLLKTIFTLYAILFFKNDYFTNCNYILVHVIKDIRAISNANGSRFYIQTIN